MKDLLSISDLNTDDIQLLLSDAEEIKVSGWLFSLSGKVLALLFEKPSLRTRVSFEIAMWQLGGQSLYLSPAEVGLGERESIPDVARVLSRYVDVIAVRAFRHETLEVLADHAGVAARGFALAGARGPGLPSLGQGAGYHGIRQHRDVACPGA